MSNFQEFQETFLAYAEKFGHTFTTIDLYPGMEAFEAAYTQMLECLSGDRTDTVTQESIGQTGEGVLSV